MTRPQRRQPRPAAPRGRPAGQGSRPGGGSGRPARAARPLPTGGSQYTPGASGTRRTVEGSSARPLVFLHQLPRWLPPVVLLVLLVTGFAVPGWIGAAALVLVAGFLGWLGYLSWPALSARGRLLRLAAVACMLALAVVAARR
jgi:Family of unknown function (DUF6703)